MLNKWVWFLGVFLFFNSAMVWGQPQIVKPGVKRAVQKSISKAGQRHFPADKIEKILESRALRTQARQTENLKKGYQYLFNEDFPGVKIMGWSFHKGLKGPYENLPFWKDLSDQAKRNYFLAANNRAGALNLKTKQQAVKNIQENLPALWGDRIKFTPQPFEKLLADMIPPQAKYILLGEEHDKSQIQVFLSKFFKEYQAKYPGRKLFLLTEFLPVSGKQTLLLQSMKVGDPSYAYILNSASSNGITVKGLEPRYVYEGGGILHLDPQWAGKEAFAGLWVTPEGMRIRNKAWISRIKELRKNNPDAVFMIYAGGSHLEYNAFASLSLQLPREETFVASLYADDPTNNEARDLLEELGEDKYPFYLEEVLSWKDASLRRIAGFDVRLLLSKQDYPFGKKRKK